MGCFAEVLAYRVWELGLGFGVVYMVKAGVGCGGFGGEAGGMASGVGVGGNWRVGWLVVGRWG
jgi:hypothetical protein